MAGPTAPRKFTAELRRGPRQPAAAGDWPMAELLDHLERVAAGLDALRGDVARALATPRPPALATAATSANEGGVAPSTPTGAQTDRDALALRLELQHLHHAIEHTKREIAVLGRKGSTQAPLTTASHELDAVVQATEGATNVILAAAEHIDAAIARLRNQASRDELPALDDLGEQVVRIFEACNFQDITGQRISKVVTTMKFIETRVDRMIEILGGPNAFAGIEATGDPLGTRGDPLLAGPQLDCDTKISQDDIDRFFN